MAQYQFTSSFSSLQHPHTHLVFKAIGNNIIEVGSRVSESNEGGRLVIPDGIFSTDDREEKKKDVNGFIDGVLYGGASTGRKQRLPAFEEICPTPPDDWPELGGCHAVRPRGVLQGTASYAQVLLKRRPPRPRSQASRSNQQKNKTRN